MKIIIIGMIICIVGALGSALFSLVKHKGPSEKTVKMLTIRVGLSIALFILLIVAGLLGWVQPHPVV